MFTPRKQTPLRRLLVVGAAALAVFGLAACSGPASSAPAEVQQSVVAMPERATVVPSPLAVSLADHDITLVTGQQAVWVDAAWNVHNGILTGDPTVVVTMPDDSDGTAFAILAVGPGTAQVKVYIETGQPAQVLNVTVVPE